MTVFVTPCCLDDLSRLQVMHTTLPEDAEHFVIVDSEDAETFEHALAARERIRLLTTSDVLPPSVERRRVSRRATFGRYDPRRYRQALPLRGWWAQQLIKLAFARWCPAEAYVCIDSDALILRPLVIDPQSIWVHQSEWLINHAWYADACRFFDISLNAVPNESHTSSPQLLGTDIVIALQAEIERFRRGRWWDTFLAEHLTEYETYAAFALHKYAQPPRRIELGWVAVSQWDSPQVASATIERARRDASISVIVLQSKRPGLEQIRAELAAEFATA